MDNLIIVKLGGSVITHKKREPPEIHKENLSRITKELSTHKGRMILVLGGGAHGHQAAHKFGYGNPGTPRKLLLSGIPFIRHNMALLSLATETNLNDNGLSAVVLAPFSFVLLKNERIFTFPLETITTALDAGLVPVLHGDVCFDIEKGASILSGDTIVAFLAEHLNASQILLGTDVDGIYTANPIDNPNAKLIYEIDETNFQELLERVGPSSSTDVTGGMHRKLEELIALTQHNQIEVIIFNMCTPNRLKDLLAGRATTCTRMHPIMK